MTCQQVQSQLSLYLYGELDFATEETVETHVGECAFCQQALAREKEWHATVRTERTEVPLDLISACRTELASRVLRDEPFLRDERVLRDELPQHRLMGSFLQFVSSAWPARVAAAALLLLVGFGAGRVADRHGFVSQFQFAPAAEAGMGPSFTRVRDIQHENNGQVRLVIDRVQQGEVTGSVSDNQVRRLLLASVRDQADPAIRVYSVQVLTGQTGSDVRDALTESVLADRNAGVRLKALEGLRPFAADPETRQALVQVLKTDANPGIRSEAIDVLLSAPRTVRVSPDLLQNINQIPDEYVRARVLASVPVY